jgi:hypothetical protein
LVPLGLNAVVVHILSAKSGSLFSNFLNFYYFEKHSPTHILCALRTITKKKSSLKKFHHPMKKGSRRKVSRRIVMSATAVLSPN